MTRKPPTCEASVEMPVRLGVVEVVTIMGKPCAECRSLRENINTCSMAPVFAVCDY